MSIEQRDPHSGYLTTGHEWNGITELNTPVPRPVYLFLILTFVFSVTYWVLMPAWPLGSGYTKGLLQADDRAAVARAVEQAAAVRSAWTSQIAAKSFADIEADPRLMADVRRTGRTLFGDNCAACHGRDAKGTKGFPNLTTASWLWGGSPEAISETIRVGINASHPDTRVSQMPAFGRDGILKRDEMDAEWEPDADGHLTVWECCQHLVRLHEKYGIGYEAAVMLKKFGPKADDVRDLAYVLYNICEKRGDAKEATAYNALIADWTDLTREAATAPLTNRSGQMRFEV